MATRRCTVFPPMQAPWLIVTMFIKFSSYAVVPCNYFCLLKDSIQPDLLSIPTILLCTTTLPRIFVSEIRTHKIQPYMLYIFSLFWSHQGCKIHHAFHGMAQNQAFGGQNLRAQIANFEIWRMPIEQSGCPGRRKIWVMPVPWGAAKRPTIFCFGNNFMIAVRRRYIYSDKEKVYLQ